MESVTLSLPEAYDLALEVLSANGFSADHAAAIARNVTAGEREGGRRGRFFTAGLRARAAAAAGEGAPQWHCGAGN